MFLLCLPCRLYTIKQIFFFCFSLFYIYLYKYRFYTFLGARYAAKHPKLIVPGAPFTYDKHGQFKVLEVYAYYQGDCSSTAGATTNEADTGM